MAYKKSYKSGKGFKKSVSRAVKKYVKKVLDNTIENKRSTLVLNSVWTSVGTNWIERSLCVPAQGTQAGQRVGNKIKIKSIELNGVISCGAYELLTDDPYNVVRIVIGEYTGAGSAPLATAGLNINSPIQAGYNNARGLLKKKYLDKVIPLMVTSTEKGGGDGYTPQLKRVKYYKKFRTPINVVFADDGATYPSCQLFMSVISDSGAVTSPGFVQGFVNVTYEDA